MLDSCRWIALGTTSPSNLPETGYMFGASSKSLARSISVLAWPSSPTPRTAVPNSRHWPAKSREMGGDSTLVELRFVEQKDESAMIDRFRRQSEAEYQELLEDCRNVLAALKKQVTLSSMERYADEVKKMMRQYRKVKSRDYFAAELSKDIEYGFSQIIEAFRGAATDFSTQLRRALEKK